MMVVESSPRSVENVMQAPASTPGSIRGNVIRVEELRRAAQQTYGGSVEIPEELREYRLSAGPPRAKTA
jgi:hypothetical protein